MTRVALPSLVVLLVIALARAFSQQQACDVSQVRLSWSGDPKTTMTVSWQTPGERSESYLEFGAEARSLDQRVEVVSSRYEYETGVVRVAAMTGLQPGSDYHYRVVCRQRHKDVHNGTFRTAPAEDVPFTFTAYGDQSVSPEAREILRRVMGEKPAFHLHLGDLSYANGNQPVWDRWLEMIEPLARRVPYMPTLGNHENEKIDGKSIGYSAYLARFALPEPEKWYTFDYGGARFVAFNTDDLLDVTQPRWLRSTLQRARDDPFVRWVIVFLHHPLYSSTINRRDNQRVIDALENIFDEFQVDLVLAGHNHNYERTYAQRRGLIVWDDARTIPRGRGTVYVVSGGGGKSLYDFTPEKPSRTAVRDRSYNYLRVRVEPEKLKVVAVRKDGSVIEEFTIQAPQ